MRKDCLILIRPSIRATQRNSDNHAKLYKQRHLVKWDAEQVVGNGPLSEQ
ncbi:hypothetical protein BpHYR1_036252 [Brachionus plicatilis]|uniref:Uncharacterized protein n=1 Tax=Brachionus plicatilis TaxID=10195 RepID=A0A3M7QYJ2_BRAPC|nr:hypothetical protein BpHYR1_036252 [Brachionus plicatilis]